MASEALWIEQIESGRWYQSASGDVMFTQIFLADLHAGRRTAIENGYRYGNIIVRENIGLVLDAISVMPTKNAEDRVEIIYRSSSSNRSPSHKDGKIHEAGDEEFELVTEIDEMSAQDALNFGYFESASQYGEQGYASADIIAITVINLVWRKWIDGGISLSNITGRDTVLPSSLADAVGLVNNYVTGEGDYETLAPIADRPLEQNPKFKVVDLSVTQDGNFLLREATLRYRPYGEWA